MYLLHSISDRCTA